MRRFFVALVFAGFVFVPAGIWTVFAATPSLASWAGNHCSSYHYSDSVVRRVDAQAYAAVAVGEGYEWGGGCWNDNDRDDTPGVPDSSGEGPDCSGLTFKAWELVKSSGGAGGTFWDKLENVHGPYSSYDFHDPVSADPFFRLRDKRRTTTMYMDAFAKRGHVGMLSSRASPSSNTDFIWEAYSDASGVGLNERAYRADSNYVAVRREGWTADCYPRCQAPEPLLVVVP